MRLLILILALAAATVVQAQPAFRGASSGTTAAGFRSASSAVYGAVKFVGAASATATTGTLTINRPSGAVAGDVMIASIGVRPAAASITAPAGWTLVRRVDNLTSQTNALAVYMKVAGSSEPASYAWQLSGSDWVAAGIQAFTRVDSANPIDVEAGQATPEGLTHATPSVTTTVYNAMIVTSHTFATATTWTPPSGMTEAFDAAYGGQATEGNFVQQTPIGATGAKTATAAGGTPEQDEGATHILALRPKAPILSIGKPAGLAENDVMIAAIGVRPDTATITPPTGWTLVRRTNNTNANGNSLAVYRKVAGSSEPAAYDWDVSGAFGASGGIQAFVNIDTTSPIDVENGQATPESLSHSTPSITTTTGNTMIVAAHTIKSEATWTPPTGMTEAFDRTEGAQTTSASHVFQPPIGATGTKTATASGPAGTADYGNTHILALRPSTPVLTIGKPTGTQQNDVMIAAIGVRPATATITAPSGWTLVRRIDNDTTEAHNSLAVYRRAAGASEPSTYAWGLSGATFTVGGIQAFSGVDTANPIDVENGQTTPYGLSHATPSVTTTVANTMVVTHHTFETATTWTPPTGMTEAYDTQHAGQSIEGNYVLQPVAGATGTKTATAAGSSGDQDEGNAHILALRPFIALTQPALYFIHVDHLDTPRLVADATGTTVWQWDQSEPFGNNVANETPAGFTFEFPLRFPGQYADKETNLHYNYFRDCYDPVLGRYCQPDPLGLNAGPNVFTYANLDPLRRSDALGLVTTCIGCQPKQGGWDERVGTPRGGPWQRWECDHSCVLIDPCDDCPNEVTGTGYGDTRAEASRNSDKSARSAIPASCLGADLSCLEVDCRERTVVQRSPPYFRRYWPF